MTSKDASCFNRHSFCRANGVFMAFSTFMMNNAFANSSFGFLAGKIQGTIVDYLMPPLSEAELMIPALAPPIAVYPPFSGNL